MHTLDRYIIRNFLYSALMLFLILMTMRIVLDLFANMDEFAKAEKPKSELVVPGQEPPGRFQNIATYYACQSTTYVVELGGIIIVAAAVFTLAWMNHTNELTAIIASGMSLRRVLLPIVLSAIGLVALVSINQEYVIPRLATELTRPRDGQTNTKAREIQLMTDGQGRVWYAANLVVEKQDRGEVIDLKKSRLEHPLVLVRDGRGKLACSVSGAAARQGEVVLEENRRQKITGWWFEGGLSRKPPVKVATPESGPASRPAPPKPREIRAMVLSAEAWPHTPSDQRVFTAASPDALLEIVQQEENLTTQQVAHVRGVPGGRARDESYDMELRYERLLLEPAVEGEPRLGKLVAPQFIFRDGKTLLAMVCAPEATWVVEDDEAYWQLKGGRVFVPSDLSLRDMDLRQRGNFLDFMSSRELDELIISRKAPDKNAALLARHIRFTDPLNAMVMLLLGVPFILSRERNIKASATLCLVLVGLFYVFIYSCRYMSIDPLLAAWLPVMIFGSIAAVMLDSVKT